MLNKQQLTWFEDLTQIDGVSGHEHEVAKYLEDAYRPLCDEIIRDNLGSIIAVKKSKKENAKRVMVLAHMDEIGFLVREVMKNGVLKIHPVGGWFSQTLLAHRVGVTTRKGVKYMGSISSIPPHMLDAKARLKPVDIPQMVVDVGATSEEEIAAMGICVGDMIVVQGGFEKLSDNRILAKAFDNRYGCVLSIDLLESLKDVELDFDLYIGASVQEEVGLRGAQTITQLVKPDYAVILDCSPSDDALNPNALGRLGDGVLIRMADGNMIASKEMIHKLIDVCVREDIKHQYYFSLGGTDAGIVHKSLVGVKTLTCCLVGRGIHTASSIIDTNDYLSAKSAVISLLVGDDFA